MNRIWRLWACAAAFGIPASCSDGTAGNGAAQPGESVTVELPEPIAAPAENAAANVAADSNEAAPQNGADEAPAATSDVEPPKPPAEKAVERKPLPPPEKDAPPEAEEKEEATGPRESASLPLPDAVIVRTIERIGYPCGSIASSSRVGGSSDYIINCSSGASYRASNRTGRYRFSKAD